MNALQTYEAKSLTEALRRARAGAGADAVLVEVRRQRLGGASRVVVAVAPGDHGLRDLLRERGLSDARIAMLLEGLSGLPVDERQAALRERLSRLLPVQPRDGLERGRGPQIVALVGPTGVGKTTTAAKLAGRALTQHRARVGFITLDLYRVAAVDQLRAYADMLAAPLEVAASPGELRGAVERLRDRDLILIDTAGRSPLDAQRLTELSRLLGCVPQAQTLLCLAANARERELRHALRRFQSCWLNGLVLTKLDESLSAGDVVELLAHSPLPLRYVCAGQEVPDDIDDARSAPLVDWVLTQPAEAWA